MKCLAGRIELKEDANGAQEFFYGPLGEVVKNVHTIIVPFQVKIFSPDTI